MIVRYNGIDIKCLVVHEHARELVMDDTGNDALYIRLLLNVVGVVNGQTNGVYGTLDFMSYRTTTPDPPVDPNVYVPPADRLPPNIIEGPNKPIATDLAIIEALLTPRRKLVVTDDVGFDSVNVPETGLPCDCRGGPTPIRAAILDHHAGDNVWTLNFQVEAFLPVCGSMPALLSNRFTQTHELDQDFGLTIVTEGTAVFRRDALMRGAPAINPDSLRQFLHLPTPPGFQRSKVLTANGGDELTVKYRAIDVQQEHVFVAGVQVNGTRVQTSYIQSVTAPGENLEAILGGYEKGLSLRYSRHWARDAREAASHEGGGIASSMARAWARARNSARGGTP